MKKNFAKLLILFIALMVRFYAISQSQEETLDYINTKQEVYKQKNYDNIYQYAIGLKESDGVKSIVIIEIVSLSGTILRKDSYIGDVKNIIAVESSLDEIGRKQIKIFSKDPGFIKLNILDSEQSNETLVELTFSKETDSEQIKSLIKSYKHLVKLSGGKDLSIDKF
jgi:hypothetical protein